MTANKSSKAAARAGGGKAARDIPDRSVTSGTEGGQSLCHASFPSCQVCLQCCHCHLSKLYTYRPEFWTFWRSASVSIAMLSKSCVIFGIILSSFIEWSLPETSLLGEEKHGGGRG